ncbi:unnamed protein product [Lactuca saligna]|uniref:Uncharacterized protein n=1 Tax=Lactuca saligna TaxID=75948 RepID=A0AA36E5R0_LACSI|nr:unnamed protein product [Lactuca saligna]
MLLSMTLVKNSVNDAVSVNASVAGDFRDRTTMTTLKVLKEIETDQESNASSSEDMEFYSPKSVVAKKWPVTTKEVNVSRARVHDPIVRIRTEDSQIGEDIGECFCRLRLSAGRHRRHRSKSSTESAACEDMRAGS